MADRKPTLSAETIEEMKQGWSQFYGVPFEDVQKAWDNGRLIDEGKTPESWWKDLTDEEIEGIELEDPIDIKQWPLLFARAVIKRFKEKNK